MSRTKADLSMLSLNQLCELTGKTYRTVKKALAGVTPLDDDGGTLLYEPFAVLPLLYRPPGPPRQPGSPEGDADFFDPVLERAKVDRQRWIKLELENQKKRGELILTTEVEEEWAKMLAACRTKVLTMPTKLAPQLVGMEDPKAIEKLIRTECREALDELKKYGESDERDEGFGSDGDPEGDPEDSEDPGATS